MIINSSSTIVEFPTAAAARVRYGAFELQPNLSVSFLKE